MRSTPSPFETIYLPEVEGARAQLAARAATLLDTLEHEGDVLQFVIRFVALRVGCLGGLPKWLRTNAELCEPLAPLAAAELRDAAAREQAHRMLLMEDLVELHALCPTMSLGSLIRGPRDPRIERHARMRALVPARDEPLLGLAVDLELGELGRCFGPALLRVCRRALGPSVEVCRFIRARVDNLDERVEARRERLEQVLRERPASARPWARVGRELSTGYLECLEACAWVTMSSMPKRIEAAA